MINLVLILPIIFCLFLLFFKNNRLNNTLIVTYAVMHSLLSLCYFLKPDFMINSEQGGVLPQ